MYAKGQHLKAVDLKIFGQVKAEVVNVSQLASELKVPTCVMPQSRVTVTCCGQSGLQHGTHHIMLPELVLMQCPHAPADVLLMRCDESSLCLAALRESYSLALASCHRPVWMFAVDARPWGDHEFAWAGREVADQAGPRPDPPEAYPKCYATTAGGCPEL